jgi:Na+/H+-translocating membrane pyrophosphatase
VRFRSSFTKLARTYLVTQGKFILILEIFIGIIIILYFGVLSRMEPFRVAIILAFSLVGIAGSYGVAWFGIRVNTFANSRTAFASLEGKPFPALRNSTQSRHEHRHDADQRGAADHVVHPAFHSR